MLLKKIKQFLLGIASFAKLHKIWSAIILIILVAVLIFLRPKPAKIIDVKKITKGDLTQTVSITGTIVADKTVNLTFQIPGTLAFLGVNKGDRVVENQTIATLDQRTALKNLRTALLNFSIQRNTFDQTNINQQAIKPVDALNENMRRLLENNQYNLDLATNSVEIQDLAREESILTTPIAGIVTRSDVKTSGVNITSATTFTVTDPSSLSFQIEVDEADISKVELGQEVDVNLDAYSDKTLHLKIDSIDFVTHVTSTGGNAFDVKAGIPANDNFTYRVGMNGNAMIITNKKSGVIIIPLSSLIEDNKVYVKVGNKYEKRIVKLGLQSDTEAQVISGLSENDLLVTDPSLVPVKK